MAEFSRDATYAGQKEIANAILTLASSISANNEDNNNGNDGGSSEPIIQFDGEKYTMFGRVLMFEHYNNKGSNGFDSFSLHLVLPDEVDAALEDNDYMYLTLPTESDSDGEN